MNIPIRIWFVFSLVACNHTHGSHARLNADTSDAMLDLLDAIRNNNPALVRAALANGADPNQKTKWDASEIPSIEDPPELETPVWLGVNYDKTEAVLAMLESGSVDLDAASQQDVLERAIIKSNRAVIQKYLATGDPEAIEARVSKVANGRSAIHVATYMASSKGVDSAAMKILQDIVSNGGKDQINQWGDLNEVMSYGSPLSIVATGKFAVDKIQVADYLVSQGANLNEDTGRPSPLYHAVEATILDRRALEIVTAYLDRGASPNVPASISPSSGNLRPVCGVLRACQGGGSGAWVLPLLKRFDSAGADWSIFCDRDEGIVDVAEYRECSLEIVEFLKSVNASKADAP